MASAAMNAWRKEREEDAAKHVVLQENKIFVKTLKGEIVLDAHNMTAGENVATIDLISRAYSKHQTPDDSKMEKEPAQFDASHY